MKYFFLITALCLWSTGLLLAQSTLNGRIVDAKDQQPLPGANILIKGTVVGTISETDGTFNLSTNQALPLRIRVTMLGYGAREVEVTNNAVGDISLQESSELLSEIIVTSNRVEERITQSPVTIEKISARTLQQSAAVDVFGALQGLKGVDLLTQSLTFRSVNMRGFGANNNNRFVQLVDGMDVRSPGLGFSFGNAAGFSDLDIESVEVIPGASSALYGPDALQGLTYTRTKSPFEYQGLSAQVLTGVNNLGKDEFGAKLYSDLAIRYAKKLGERLAFKINFQTVNGTDFIADDYNDRSTRGRRGFFATDNANQTVRIAYSPNNNPATNLEYDGVNIYGDDITNGGAFDFPNNFAQAALAGKRVTRTGYTELELLDNEGRVFSHRLNAALHYKVSEKVELSAAYYYGNGNFIRTAAFREYFPSLQRHQAKLELRGDEFFVRGYTVQQTAEGYSLGNLGIRMLTLAKATNTWANEFAAAFASNGGNISAARNTADAGKFLPGSTEFNRFREELINTPNNQNIPSRNNAVGLPNVRGVQLIDNSDMLHFEGMYNFKRFLPEKLEVVTGASFRRFLMETQGTIFPATATGEEFTINEVGAYVQASYNLALGENASFKPTVALRYDKNQYLTGGVTPRASGVLSLGQHNFRASWQSAFRNPSANQLLADGQIGEVGGSQTALDAANVFNNPIYTEASVLAFRTGGDPNVLVRYNPDPDAFTTEKIQTWEVGYKTLLGERLYADVFYYRSTYSDFIAAQNYVQSTASNPTVNDLRNTATTRTLGVNFNNFNEIFVNGFGVGLEYALGKGYNLAFNYAFQDGLITLRDNNGVVRKDPFGQEIVKRRMSDPEVAVVGRNFFISPKHRFNLSFSNPRLTERLGFSASFRWTDEMWVEQGNTQGDIWLPAWTNLDAAVTYRLPAVKTLVKLGATNLTNNYYAQGYGLARIGGMYYLSLRFDEMLR